MDEEKDVIKTEEVVIPKREDRNIKNVQEDDDFFDAKTKKSIKGRSVISRIINVILWIVLLLWIAVCLIDFYNVKKGNDPKFCITKETITYSDGTVDSCLGAGYRVYVYNRNSYKAREFGPFWRKDRTANNK